MLEARGIVCDLRNANLMGAAGGGLPGRQRNGRNSGWPAMPTGGNAQAILADWRAPKVHDLPDWTCPKCGEKVEAQFDVCWKCGQAKPE